MVVSSNLLAGGMEDKYLHIFSEKSKDKMKIFTQFLGEKEISDCFGGACDHDDEMENLGIEDDMEDICESILTEGKNSEVDLVISLLQQHL
jgi:hypothetical protein